MTHRAIWYPPGSPFPAWADHPTADDAHRHALALSREIGDEVAVVEIEETNHG